MKRTIRMAIWSAFDALAEGLSTLFTLGRPRDVPQHTPLQDDARIAGSSRTDWDNIWADPKKRAGLRSGVERAFESDPARPVHGSPLASFLARRAEQKRFDKSLRDLHELLKDSDGVRSSVPGWTGADGKLHLYPEKKKR